MGAFVFSLPSFGIPITNTFFFIATEDIYILRKSYKMRVFYHIFILLLLSLPSLAQIVRYVAPNGNGSHTGIDWGNAMTLSEANTFVNVTTSANGFELRLLAGVYQISQTFTTSKGIKISGGYNGVGESRPSASITTLDGLGQIPIAQFRSQVSIDRVNFENGYSDENLSAGALWLSGNNFSVTNCRFLNNTYSGGTGAGAVFVDRNEDGKIENCSFKDNKIVISGGSTSNAAALNVRMADRINILNCHFENNSTPYSAAAIYLWGDDNLVDNCTFIKNIAKKSGGAINMNAGWAKILNSKFDDNHTDENGGAINTFNDEMYISNCSFTSNSAIRGGAIYNIATNLTVISSLFSGNKAATIGGGIFIQDNLNLVNCTLVNNTNSALGATRIDNDMTANVNNSIFYQNTVFEDKSADLSLITNTNSGDLNMSQNIVQDFSSGTNNQIGVNPQFVNVAANDYRLLPTSPAVNAGLNSWFAQRSETSLASSVDLNGDSRLRGANVDLGAYEQEDNNVRTPQTITASSLEKTYGAPDFTHGSTTSNLPLSYASSDNTIASIVTVGGQQRIKINKVGTVNITVSQAGNAQFDAAANLVFALKVNPKVLNLSATASNKVFDGNATATATLTDDRITGDNISLSFTASFDNANVGNNKTVTVTGITLAGPDAVNYVLASTTLTTTANITARVGTPQTIIASNLEKTYGDLDFTNGSSTSNLPLSYVSSDNTIASIVTVSSQQRIKINKVGTVNITASQAGNAQFDAAANVVFALKVNPKVLSLSATASNKVFDGNATATATVTDDRITGDNISLSFTASFDNANVGDNKTVTVTGITLAGSDAANYSLASTLLTTTANITAAPVALTVTARRLEKAYGESDPVLTFESSDPSIPLTGNLVRVDGENVGEYNILQGNLSAGPNVTINFITEKFIINKAVLIVTPQDVSICERTELPEFIIDYDGFKFDETEDDLAQRASVDRSLLSSSLGSYDLIASGAASNNYDFVYNVGKLMVNDIPEVTISSSRGTTIRKGSETVLTTSPFGAVNWSTDIPCINCNTTNPGYVVKPLVTTTYTLNVTNANGCMGSASITIKVVDKFEIPNTFSPNGDGVNDTWNVKSFVFTDQFKVDIFSRNGNRVFTDYNGMAVFDGTFNGRDLPVGVYYYIIDLQDGEKFQGSLTLIR